MPPPSAPARPAERFPAWVVVMVIFWLVSLVESLSWSQFGAYTPTYLTGLGVSRQALPAWTAAMSSLTWLIGIPLAPLWGVWGDRYSRTAIIVRSSLVEAVIFAGWAFAGSPLAALGFRMLSGFVLGNTGAMLAVQASTTPRQRIGLAVGVISAGGPAGRALGPLIGAVLIHTGGIRTMLLVDAAASLAVGLLIALVVREPHRERPVAVSAWSLLRGAYSEILASPWVWRLFVATFLGLLAVSIALPLQPLFIANLATGDRVTVVGAVFTAAAAAAALSSPLWGRLADRFGAIRVLVMASIGAAMAMAAQGYASSIWAFAAAMIVAGALGGALMVSTMAVLATSVSVQRRGAVLGQVYLPSYVAGLAGPPIGAVLYSAGRPWLFTVAALVMLSPIAILVPLRGVPPPEAT